MTARDLGLPIRAHVDTDASSITSEQRIKAFCESDICLLYQPIGEGTYHNAATAKSFLPSKRDDGWKWPPTIIVDSDDNIFNVTPYNSAFRHLGIRDHEGRDLPLKHTIGHIRDGKREVLWQDGQDLDGRGAFDIARNRQTIETYRKMLELADAVTCSTPHVAQMVKGDSTPRRVNVFPNLVRFDHYEQPNLVEDQKQIKILWQGGASHYEDWYPLRDSLGEITRKYPEVHWIIWGQLYPWVTELIPPDRYTFVDWCAYTEYKLRLVMMGHQINLAPLHDDRFNRCRSAIKFYEGSVLRKPAATLAQRTGPYKDEILDGETGLLFDTPEQFTEKLSTLIEDRRLRETLGKNAKDWISTHRDAFKHVPKMVAFWEELREVAQREQPHMPDEDWTKFIAQVEAEEKAQEEALAAVEA